MSKSELKRLAIQRADAQSRAGEAGANLTDVLAAEKHQETEWNNFWREREHEEREIFEKSYSRHKLNRHHGGTGEYEHRYVEHCWHGWMDRAFVIYMEADNDVIQGPRSGPAGMKG